MKIDDQILTCEGSVSSGASLTPEAIPLVDLDQSGGLHRLAGVEDPNAKSAELVPAQRPFIDAHCPADHLHLREIVTTLYYRKTRSDK